MFVVYTYFNSHLILRENSEVGRAHGGLVLAKSPVTLDFLL